ncbi:MBL fold metallo-hydrolase [Mycetocola lacteus]|uniref:MBL fold metallo-hydrolase n=1 Tax=Mycetocola lacteus TaxID=76637 RepID=A0A3L7AU12_9MICO|nr:MBL fold metallo-hydrolase [Mycetocola lacteus]RLP82862.1 MBL fold metallo-hydrolase [Mycetocola lacteus]
MTTLVPSTPVRVDVLDVGQGSCAIIRTGDGVTVIDGGARREYAVRTDPVTWLRENGITRIDDLILTHLHRDHVQGLVALAKAVSVLRAHLPYPQIREPAISDVWRERFRPDAHVDSPDGQIQSVREFAELTRLLRVGGTTLLPFSPGTDPTVWTISGPDGFSLERVYPVAGDTVTTPGLVAALADISPERAQTAEGTAATTALIHEISERANAESGVFILHRVGTAEHATASPDRLGGALIFAGDHAGEGSHWEAIHARDRAGLLHDAFWILPHHGGDDGPAPEWLAEREPRALLASVNTDHALLNAEYWARLRAVTGVSVRGTHNTSPVLIENTSPGITLRFG